MSTRVRIALGGTLIALALLALAFTAGVSVAQTLRGASTTPATPPAGTAFTHEQMDQMMDAVHGPGTSQKMHEAMGPDGEKLMDQCVAMMGMMGMMGTMQQMQGMMGGEMSGMMGGQNSPSMRDLMSRMMGR
ncbi:MAG: hypothetical protein HYY04_11225 [Chloroflexi bacterium]|nr:hypothetical protein [Chloroflexota bacterium]